MIDLSDGLSSDLGHILTASGVGATITARSVPVDPAIFDISEHRGRELELALNGGEDFELLFTVVPEKVAVALNLDFHQIGEITGDPGILELIRDGKRERLKAQGYRHF